MKFNTNKKLINLRLFDYIILYFHKITCDFCCKKQNKMRSFFKLGKYKISKELDIIRIIK